MKGEAMPEPTWKPHSSATQGRLSTAEKDSLPTTAFAFPRARKEPMTDATHVRDAMARFNQVGGREAGQLGGMRDTERQSQFRGAHQSLGIAIAAQYRA